MNPSETLRKLIEAQRPTVGNHTLRKLLGEIADEVENVERERDDAIDELTTRNESRH